MEYHWHVMENQLDLPPANQTYIVAGYVIKEGREERTVRMDYWLKDSKKWAGGKDMVIESWTEIPTPWK